MPSKKPVSELDKLLTTAAPAKRAGTLHQRPEIVEAIDRYIERIDDGTTQASCKQLRDIIARVYGVQVSTSSVRGWVRERRDAKTQG